MSKPPSTYATYPSRPPSSYPGHSRPPSSYPAAPSKPPSTYPSHTRQPAPKSAMQLSPPPGQNGHSRDFPPTYHPSRNGSAEWHTGLLGCCTAIDVCCPAIFCPCMTHSRLRQRLNRLQTGQRPPRSSMDGNCALYGLLTLFGCWGWVLDKPLRGEIRDRYNIPGSSASDCLSTCLCPPCALTQESQELALEEHRLRTEALQGPAGIYGLPAGHEWEDVVDDPVGCGEVCGCCCRVCAGAGGRVCCWI